MDEMKMIEGRIVFPCLWSTHSTMKYACRRRCIFAVVNVSCRMQSIWPPTRLSALLQARGCKTNANL